MVVMLSQLAPRSKARIVRVGGEPCFRRRLMELGLVPGTDVQIVRVAPLGDPIELSVRGSRLSIRRSEAELLAVAQPEAAGQAASGPCNGCAL